MATRDDAGTHSALSAQVFQILLSLLDEDLHGYALIQDIRRRTDGEISLTASTLYAAVKRLLASEWIEEVEQRILSGRRRCRNGQRPRRRRSGCPGRQRSRVPRLSGRC